MSHTETHFGKLRKIETELSIEEWCKEYCNSNGISEISSTYNDSWIDEFFDRFYNKFIISNDNIYEIFDHIEADDDDVDYLHENPDGTYTFVMQFYNGGTCLSECLEEGLNRLAKS